MRTRAFTVALAAVDLTLRSVSLGAVQLLQRLTTDPLPLAASNAVKDPTGQGMLLGPLIRHGLASFDRAAQVYTATDKGRDYLAKLKAGGLIGEEVGS